MRETDRSPPTNVGAQNLAFAEILYVDWLRDPQSVSADWRAYFESLPKSRAALGPSFRPASIFNPAHDGRRGSNGSPAGDGRTAAATTHGPAAQDRIGELVHAHRALGHLAARLDPLGRSRPEVAEWWNLP